MISIMLDDNENGISHIHRSKVERQMLAKESVEYNKKRHADILKKFTRFLDENGNPREVLEEEVSSLEVLEECNDLGRRQTESLAAQRSPGSVVTKPQAKEEDIQDSKPKPKIKSKAKPKPKRKNKNDKIMEELKNEEINDL